MTARLALEDGTVFTGISVGAPGTRVGEVVFNTAMTGYQEVFTDPSYCGQIVTMTFPLLGNYGVNAVDRESDRTYLSGVVLRELPRRPSNFRAECGLADYFVERGIVALAGVDTRAITRRVRAQGALRGALSTELGPIELVRQARSAAPMVGANLVQQVTPAAGSHWDEPLWTHAAAAAAAAHCHVVAIDGGIKHNILRHLVSSGCRVSRVPATTTANEIRALRPDGVLVGNGPGDPAAVIDLAGTLRQLAGKVPLLGICLGHQLLGLALGAATYKLPFGHHGANLPVLNRETGQVEITSQNHGFAVDAKSLEATGATITHLNLNDDTVEGFRHAELNVVAVQFHPEASPGPHDATHVFADFVERIAHRGDAGMTPQRAAISLTKTR
jgi:carbamoyl-phosphate synthase small subunit